MLKLGTKVEDSATGLKGMLVNMSIQGDRSEFYNFQPWGLSPETGEPVDRFWITRDRIIGGMETPDGDVPVFLLNTLAQDSASGFAGTITEITLYISGCVHLTLQPPGVLKKTGQRVKSQSFDIRQCTGPAIKDMGVAEREADKKKKPSPFSITRPGPVAI